MTDLARLAEGRVGAQFWSIYIPGEIKDSGFARVQLEQFDIARRMIARYPDRLALALTADDIERAKKQKKIASLLGMEGGHAIENSLGALRCLLRPGRPVHDADPQRHAGLGRRRAGQRRHGGLTEFGQEVVHEMNRLGMLVDLSHVSPGVDERRAQRRRGAGDLLPLLLPARWWTIPRNVPDSILARLPQNGGVVMVTFVPGFVSRRCRDAERRSGQAIDSLLKAVTGHDANGAALRERVQRQLTRSPARRSPRWPTTSITCGKVAGVDHVGIGSDFDGIDARPRRAGGRLQVPGPLRRADPPGLERRGSQEAGGGERAPRPATGGGGGEEGSEGAGAVDGDDRRAGS